MTSMLRIVAATVLCAVMPHVGLSQIAPSQPPIARGTSSVNIDVAIDSVIGARAPALFGFGGNIWALPSSFPTGVSTRILEMPALGITRLSLGVQVLQDATSLVDLRQRLATLPVNAFLSAYKARGGRILLILDGTPRWLSTNKSTARVVGPDEPAFNLHPPQRFLEWSDVVEAIVRHFNGTLGLNAYYEVRNEPNYFYYGTNEQFFRQYYYTVLGARRADPAALVGGPGISEFTGVATAGESPRTDADKLRLVENALSHRFLFR